MPSTSKNQQNFFRLVNAVKKGGLKPSEVSQPVKEAAKSMSQSSVEDFLKLKKGK